MTAHAIQVNAPHAPHVLVAEVRWLWSTWYGQLAILTVLTGLLWLTGWGTPALLLLALTRRRLLADFPTAPTAATS